MRKKYKALYKRPLVKAGAKSKVKAEPELNQD